MQTNATVERLLNLSACYFGLRACGADGDEDTARAASEAGQQQGGSFDPATRAGH